MPYRWIYCLLIPFGAISRVDVVWAWGDLMNALQVFPNLIGVIGLSGIVAKMLRSGHALRAVDRQPSTIAAQPLSPLDRHANCLLPSDRNSFGCIGFAMASQTLPVVSGDKDRSLQEALGRLTASPAAGRRRGRPDRHRDPPAAGGRGRRSRRTRTAPTTA